MEDNNNKTGRSPQTCDFYNELHEIFASSDHVKPKSVCGSIGGTRKRKITGTGIEEENEVISDDQTSVKK